MEDHSENCSNIDLSKRKEISDKKQNKYIDEKESNNILNDIEPGINTGNKQNNDNKNLDNDEETNLEVNNNQFMGNIIR